jgi:hypothetical protein
VSERKTVAGAYAKMDSHEAVCAERWKGVDFKLNLLFAALGTGVLLALGAGGWAMNLVVEGQQAQLQQLRDIAKAK